MRQYLDLVNEVLELGERRKNRTGVDTIGIFGYQMRFSLHEAFPLMTTKKLHWRSIAYELLWFLRGDTNLRYLHDHGVRIWDEWADAQGDLGPIYGHQWRSWHGADGRVVDQIKEVEQAIRETPDSRRLLVSAWNVADIPSMALPPCHALFQFYVSKNRLSCQLYQRSADIFLGVPFNIASYALLTYLMAHATGLEVGEFIHTLGDAHIYVDHLDAIREQLTRTPKALPQLRILSTPKHLYEYTFDDFTLEGYNPDPHIAGKVAV